MLKEYRVTLTNKKAARNIIIPVYATTAGNASKKARKEKSEHVPGDARAWRVLSVTLNNPGYKPRPGQKKKKCLHCSARIPLAQVGGNCKKCQAKYEESQRKPNPAKFGKWYKHPQGGMVRVRHAGGRIIVDLKK